MTRKYFPSLLIAVLVIFLFTQMQPVIVERIGGVAGSFGVRPVSHDCLGFIYSTNGNRFFPSGEIEFRMIKFDFRYSVSDVDNRPLCVGQDIWYGE